MKRIKIFFIVFAVLMSLLSCQNEKEKKFTNPILSGFYPDPSICKVENDYYLINSTFSYFPGIPIFHSKNLVDWELIGHVLDRPEQLDLDSLGVSRGLFAPAISYDNGIFYVVCTLVGRQGNFVVTSKNPEGPYSDPVYLPEVNGIDPSLFFDEDGKTYLVFNSNAPEDKPLYEGHRTIKIFEFDKEELKVIGDEKILVNGGSDLNKKPIWIEGPHIYKNFDHYYLMAAEGGTAEDHAEVIFRSKNIFGPYESYRGNPILTQRHLDPKRKNPITSTGHADLIETQTGEWWAVFLGCRPYEPFENNDYNLGRETFLAPVKWIEDKKNKVMWPVINPDFEEVQYYYDYPSIGTENISEENIYSGNFTLNYGFDDLKLHKNFIFLRTPKEKWYSLSEKEGYLTINLRPETCSEPVNPSFIGHRQQHNTCKISTSLEFSPKGKNEKAGLLAFMNEEHFYFMCKSIQDKKTVIQLYKGVSDTNNVKSELITSKYITDENRHEEVKLKMDVNGKYVSFKYSFDNSNWESLQEKADATYLKAEIPRDFTGLVVGMYATSSGIKSSIKAHFNNFLYEGNDEVYLK